MIRTAMPQVVYKEMCGTYIILKMCQIHVLENRNAAVITSVAKRYAGAYAGEIPAFCSEKLS